MINSPPPVGNAILTVIKPLGKPITLVVGDIVEAEVVDILDTGGITLRMNGAFLTAKTGVPLQKDAVALFKVLPGGSGTELKLQFLGYSGKTLNAQTADTRRDSPVEKALRDLSWILLKEGTGTKPAADAFEKIFRDLTPHILSAPQEFEVEVAQMLRTILDSAGFFQAFLPSGWQGLKYGDMSFRKVPGDKKYSYSCRVDLDLAKYGKLSVDLLLVNREFFVYFRVADDGLKEMMNSHLAELKEEFAGIGSGLKVTFLDKTAFPEGTQRSASGERIVDIKA